MSDEFDPYHLWLGIPREEQPPNHYRLLGLRPFEDNHEVISYALDQRSAHLRSFQTGRRGVQSQRVLNEVAAAGVCLLDPIKRAEYDEQLRASLPAPARPAKLPVAKVIPLEQPAPTAANLPIVTAPYRSAAAAPRASGGWIMIIAAIAACGLLVAIALAVLGGWLPGSTTTAGQPKPTGDKAVPKPKNIEPPEKRSSAAPPAAAVPATTPRAASPLPPASPREAWLPNHAGFAIRRVGDQWIEFQRSKEYWFDTATSLPAEVSGTGPVELADPVRGLTLRLYDDRLELKAARQGWAVVAPGRWAGPGELPGYAGRSPRRPPPGWPVLNPTAHALVFCGQESVRIPVPEEIRTSAASDFTLEAWIRWDRLQPVGTVFTASEGSLSLVARRPAGATNSSQAGQSFLALGSVHEVLEVTPDRWIHLAVHVRGRDWRLFQNGALMASGTAPEPLLTGDHLKLGAKENGLCGMIRDFRISRGFPYPARFMPPLKLAADEQTLVQLQMKATAGGAIKNLAPRGGTAMREGARWIPLTPEYQLAAERADGSVDLIQAFAVLDEPLEGRQVLKWPEKIEAGQTTGRTRLMVPFRPPAEYDVALECTRLAGEGGVFLGLSIAGRPAILAIDAFPELGGRTGILPRDLGQADRAATLHRAPPILRPEAPVAMLVKVRLPEQNAYWVEVEHAGRAVASIRGQIADLDAPPEFQIPMLYGMSLGTQDARIRFADVILRTAE